MQIGSNAALANNGTASFQNDIVAEFLGIKITASAAIPKAGLFWTYQDIIDWLDDIMINTKITDVVQTLSVNMPLFKLGLASQDFHGAIEANINWSDGTDLVVYIPVIQADGRIDRSWQIDILNTSGQTIAVEVVGSSTGKSTTNTAFQYQPAILDNDLSRPLSPNFRKLLVENVFDQINYTCNGAPENLKPSDARILTNLDDTLVMIVNTDEGTYSTVVMPSRAGYVIFDNDDNTQFTEFTLFRLAGGDAINYFMVSPKQV